MHWLLGMALAVSSASISLAANILVIDDFEYADQAAATLAWKPAEGSDPIQLMERQSEGGTTALKLPCPFARGDLRRTVYDRDVQLDLSTYGSITFDFYAADVGPIAHCTIYFHSGQGWYARGFAPQEGWGRYVFGKASFTTEDEPGGWDRVDRIRISVWKLRGEDTFCGLDNLHARAEDVVVVRGSSAGAEADTAKRVADRISSLLSDLGVLHDMISDEDVEGGALQGHRLAIFAYSPSLSEEAVAQVESFVEKGGKIIVFYTAGARMASLLGLVDLQYRRREVDGQFARVVFDTEALPGLPPAIAQGSWNITACAPGGRNAQTVGMWESAEGISEGPAVVVSDTGAFMGHILTEGDDQAKGRLLLALVGHFVPWVWEGAVREALARAGRVGPFEDQGALETYLKQRALNSPREAEIVASLARAEAAAAQARALYEEGRYPEALEQAARLHEALAEAYTDAHSPRDGEFRAVWNHSGTGDCGTWDEAMKRLAAANFNAVVPNMWWAGLAHYDSSLLPHSQTFMEKGDQIAQCVEAGKKYGIEVHPWKVNWNLSTAPEEFVARMRAEGRLQKTHSGQEINWLCPSDPRNFELELATMLEVVRNYDVDGVHFDYIRYPHEDSCYCDGCRERFEAATGVRVENWPEDCYFGPLREQYREWRCTNINRLVQATAEQARRIKPHIKISAAVFPDYPVCRTSVGQDWVLWCKQGWLDFVCPMDYTETASSFKALVSLQVGLVGGAVPVYSGIGAFIIPDHQVIHEIEISRDQGADGFILFNMGELLASQTLPKLARAITSQPATLPHNAPVIQFKGPREDGAPVTEVPGDVFQVEVHVPSLGAHRIPATAARGTIELQDLAGNGLAALAPLPQVGATQTVQVERTAGTFRLAAVGEMVMEDGTTRRFIVRSRPYRFAPQQ